MYPPRRRSLALLPLFLMLLGLLAACAPQAVAPEPAQEGAAPAGEEAQSLRVAIIGDESTLTPYTYVTGYPGWNLLTLQYDTLYQLDLAGVPQPWLATGSTVSEDGLTVTLDLREDVTWHDGEPFTAGDVVFTVDYFKQYPQSRFTRALRPVESAVSEGDYQVVLTLATPTPSLEIGVLADVPILPQHVWSEVTTPDEQTFEGGNIGTGPFKLVEYVPDQFYRFEANDAYFAGAPVVDELVAVQFADDAGTVAALRSGEVDMIVRPVAPEQIDLLQAAENLAVLQGPQYTTEMIVYDMTRAPFNEPVVRRAMSLAIDRQDLVDTVYLGAATLGSNGWIHPASPVYNPDIETLYDPDQAVQLLDDAGITDSDGDGIRELNGEPLSVEFILNGSDSLRLRIAELVSSMLAEIGIEARVSAVEQATWEAMVWPEFDVSKGRDYDMAMWGWSAPVQADPVRMGTLVHSDPAIGSLNLTGYNNPEADALAETISTEMDPEASTAAIRELQAIIAEDLPFIMLLYPDGAYGYNSATYDGWAFMSGQGVFHKLSLLEAPARP